MRALPGQPPGRCLAHPAAGAADDRHPALELTHSGLPWPAASSPMWYGGIWRRRGVTSACSTASQSLSRQPELSPPSTTTTAPVTYDAASLSRKTFTFAICSGRPVRSAGMRERCLLQTERSATHASVADALITPGATALTRIA